MAKTVVSAVKPGGAALRRSSGLSCFRPLRAARPTLVQWRVLHTQGALQPLVMNLPSFVSSFLNTVWPRRLAKAATAVLVLWILGWLAVPPILRSQGEQLASEALGRKVSIGEVRFRPWSLELSLHDVAIADAEGKGALLRVQRIYMDAELQSLLRLAPVVDALEVDAPALRITQLAPGHTDVDDIIERLSQPGDSQASPLGFALYNIAVQGGSVDFVDRTVDRTHEVRDLRFALPFIGNLGSQRQIKVAPRLAFTLNGSAFESTAEATPFTENHHTEARFQLKDFDLSPYRGYLPASLPLRLDAGRVDADLRLSFEQNPATVVQLSGMLRARDVLLNDAQKQELLAFDALEVRLTELQPFKRLLRIEAVELEAPRLALRRDGAGRLNLGTSDTSSTPPRAASAKASSAASGGQGNGWRVDVGRVAVRDGKVTWRDDGVAAKARVDVHNLALRASAVSVPFTHPMQFAGSLQVAAPDAGKGSAELAFAGDGTDRQGKVAVSVRSLPLELAAPYLAQWITPRLGGALEVDAGVAWNGAALVAQVAGLGLDEVVLSCGSASGCAEAAPATVAMRGGQSLAELKRLRVEDARIDLAQRSVRVGRLALTQPRAFVDRAEDRRWMFERWQTAKPQAAGAAPQAAAAPWSVQLANVEVDGGAVAFRDTSPGEPVAFAVTALRLRLQDLAPLAPAAKPSAISLSARVGAGRADPGRLEYEGTLGLAPLQAQGKVLASQLPLHVFEPYVASALHVDIRRADGSFRGLVQFADTTAGPRLGVQGDAALEDVRVRMAPVARAEEGAATDAPRGQRRGEELLNWKSLGLRGLDVSLAPGKPVSVEVRETALSDFYARIIVQANGRINLQDMLKSPTGPAAEPSAPPAVTASAPVAAGAEGVASTGMAPVVRFGPVSLTGGRVHFTDYFIQPNYSADLSELTGRLSAFSSEPPSAGAAPEMADLELRGKAEGTAALEITGKLNPLAKPLALDIQGRMRDLELPPLSPYTIKYAGHGVERGKLSMDVNYRVQPDGQLTASNKLVLNQLTFGDPVQGAPASLPVKLAVALLADRNGVIDVDLPISGSLNDPEFRLGSVIFKVIGNLILKAVTAPFSLLASAFGGGDELGSVPFAAGSAVLDEAALKGLDKVVQALTDRPALKMTVAGMASLEAERDAWKRGQLQQSLLAQKRRAALRAGQSADEVKAITAEEYPALLKEVYRRADIAKPRNLVGIAKDLPPGEMEALLLASIPVSEASMRELALARGVAVRDYLASRQLPADRLFLGAVKVVEPEASWHPHAELTLATR